MFILGQYVGLPTILLGVACLIFLVVLVVFIVLYLQAKDRVVMIGNTSTVTGQIVPSRYSNKSALSPFQAIRGSTAWRMLFVGDFGFAQINTTTQSLFANEADVPFLVANLIENSQSIGQPVVTQSVFGYDAALKDARVTMSGDWSTAPNAAYGGAGGRYFNATSSTATITFKPTQVFPNSVQFYALATSGKFTLSATSNGSAVVVTPTALTPIPTSNLVKYSYTLNNVATYPAVTITATGATASTPVQIWGFAQEGDFRNIVNTSVASVASTTLADMTAPTSLLNGGLRALSPNLVVIQNPVTDYTTGMTPDQSANNIRQILIACSNMNIPVLAVTPPWVKTVSEDTQKSYSDTYKLLYAQYANVMVYDFQADMVSFATQTSLNLSSNNYLTLLGATRMAQGIYGALLQ